MQGPGYLAVTIQPGNDTDLNEFHDWYDNEHGPLRLRLPFIETGDRYAAIDDQKPAWSAVYDVSDLAWLNERIYTRLREERSAREKTVMATLASLDRKIYSLISSRGTSNGPAPVTWTISLRIPESDLDAYNRWHDEEHTDLMSQIPGWLRSRRFRMVVGGSTQGMPPPGEVEVLAVHDFAHADAFDSPEREKATSTPWTHAISQKASHFERRTWKHHVAFAPLEEPPSAVLTTDNAALRFQLEGDPSAPVIVCVNSILTTLHIWDDVAAALLRGAVAHRPFRVLRYNSRGYTPLDPVCSNPPDFDLLADDLEYLLQRLRIPRVHAVIGVSMGGVTALNFAIRHPAMLERVVACDCNVASSAANSAAWAERVSFARKEGMGAFAEATVKRWFAAPERAASAAARVRCMVADADLRGFELNSLALSEYDLRPRLERIRVPGLLVAGAEDGKIPAAMGKFGIQGARLAVLPAAGHLPFLENLEGFLEALGGFL